MKTLLVLAVWVAGMTCIYIGCSELNDTPCDPQPAYDNCSGLGQDSR